MSSVCEAPIPAAAEFFAQIAFADVTGNGDAPARNFSVVADQSGRWQPTPAYDVPSPQLDSDQTVARSIEGRRDENISGARFLAVAVATGLPERAAGKAPARVADSADTWLDSIDQLPFDVAELRMPKRVVVNRQKMLRTV